MGILTFEGRVCHASSCTRHSGVFLNTLLLWKGEGEGSSSPSPCTSLYSSLPLVLFIRFQPCLNVSKASSFISNPSPGCSLSQELESSQLEAVLLLQKHSTWRYLWLPQVVGNRNHYWHLMGRGQGCFQIPGVSREASWQIMI